MPIAHSDKHEIDSLLMLCHINGYLTISDLVQMWCHTGKRVAIAFCTISDPSGYLGDIEIKERRICYAKVLDSSGKMQKGDLAVCNILKFRSNIDASVFAVFEESRTNVVKDSESLLLESAAAFDESHSQ